MTKQKPITKRALFMSALALLLCVSMLVGSTYAWFSDTVTSGGNVIKSGILDVDFLWRDAVLNDQNQAPDYADAATAGPIFNYELWEPGYVSAKNIGIANVGTLALQYWVTIETAAGTTLQVNANGHTLADAIDVYYIDEDVQFASREAFNTYVTQNNIPAVPLSTVLGQISGAGNTAHGVLYPAGTNGRDSAHNKTIVLKMREEAGNEYQNMELGTAFSVKLFATQWTWEEDSFDEWYDLLRYEFPFTLGSSNLDGALHITSTTDPDITADIPGDNTTLQYKTDKDSTGWSSFDVTDHEDDLVLYVTEEDRDETSITYDISLENETHHYEIEALNKVVAIHLPVPQGLQTLTVKHNGVDMIAATTGANQTYTYDSANGILTIYTSTFSPFKIQWTLPGESNTPTAVVDAMNVDDIGGISLFTNKEYTNLAKLDKAYAFNAFNESDMALVDQFVDNVCQVCGKSNVAQLDLSYFEDEEVLSAALEMMTEEQRERILVLFDERGEYFGWRADFEVTFNRDIAPGSVVLAGHYDSFADYFNGGSWIAFGISKFDWNNGKQPLPIPAGETVRLLDTMYQFMNNHDFHMNYAAICLYVQVFRCGFANLDEANTGAEIDVRLCLYKLDQYGNETGERIECGRYVETLPAVSAANTSNIEAWADQNNP